MHDSCLLVKRKDTRGTDETAIALYTALKESSTVISYPYSYTTVEL